MEINKILNFFYLFFFGVCIYFILGYQYALLNTKYYVEPAENESLVYLQSNSFKNNSEILNNFFSEGIIPIYPDVFYNFSSLLMDDSLLSLRLLNVVLYWIIIFFVTYTTYLKTKNIFYSFSVPLIVYGVSEHSVYFYMARPDGIYIAFGILSLVLISFRTNYIYHKLFGAALLSSLSLLSKQSGLFFILLILIILFSEIIFNKKNNARIKYFLTYFFGVFIILSLYFLIFPISYQSFDQGLNLYGSDYSISHIYTQTLDLFINYWWLILFVFLILYELFRANKKNILLTNIFIWIFTVLISIKLFSNSAAHYNNYILFSLVLYYSIINNYKFLNFKKTYYSLLFFGLIFGYFDFNNNSINIPLKERTERINKNGKLEDSDIYKYINQNDGLYISSRADNFLYYNQKNIIYEASVFDNVIFLNNRLLKNKIIQAKIEDINNKLSNNHFKGIITGINGLMEINFPAIEKNYKVIYTEEIEAGDWPHKIKLWIKK